MPSVEVILCEVAFLDSHHSGNAVFGQIAAFLWDRGFEVYDVATLLPRVRDNRLLFGDVVFVRRDSALRQDVSWL